MSSGGPGDVDTGEEGVAPRRPEDAWQVGAGIVPDDAAEGEATVAEALASQTTGDEDADQESLEQG